MIYAFIVAIVWQLVVENWYWIVMVLIPLLLAVGTKVAAKTETKKDDKFFAKANAIYAAIKEVILGIKQTPPKKDNEKG